MGAAGIPEQPNVFYIGVNNGGVWKTDDYGRTWKPIFDDQPTGSIGAIAVAPSDPNIIYVGSGEGLQRPDLSVGDGMYKSTDAGKTWRHLGLRDGQQIPAILVDPRNPNRLFVAVLGHPYGPECRSAASSAPPMAARPGRRCSTRTSTPARSTWPSTRAIRRPSTPCCGRRGRVRGRTARSRGPNSGLFKSTDGGTTWKPLAGGLPSFAQDGLGRIGIGIAPSDPQSHVRAGGGARQAGGVYRSDDAGANWQRVNSEQRIYGRGSDFACVRVDPKNKDVIYVANTSTYRSTDAGQTFTAIKGAPGGDDYHTIWINPQNPDIILLAADQGATITRERRRDLELAGTTSRPRSSITSSPTTSSRTGSTAGSRRAARRAWPAAATTAQITFRDWHPVGAEEYGYVAPDPLNPEHHLRRQGHALQPRHRRSADDVAPARQLPLPAHRARCSFSDVDPHVLYLGAQVVLKTTDGGENWDAISPDLSRETYDAAGQRRRRIRDAAKQQATRRGVVYSIAPSRLNVNVIWAGTDDGLIHVTRDGGKNWKNVTPPGVTPWSKVAQLDASHFDDDTVYAAVNRLRAGRSEAAHLAHARWRRDLEGDRARPARRSGERRPRRSGAQGTAVRRHRTRRLRQLQRWRRLAAAAPEHAGDFDPRSGGARRRSGGRHARPRLLDPRRHLAAAPVDGGDRRAAAHLFAPRPTYRFRATPTPIRRCRPKSPPARIRRTARSSITT